jgi:hypothetical protein
MVPSVRRGKKSRKGNRVCDPHFSHDLCGSDIECGLFGITFVSSDKSLAGIR